MRLTKRKIFFVLVVFAVAASLGCVFAAEAGRFLVINNPMQSDFIVVLAGDIGDIRAEHGLMLLRKGYASQLVLDAPNWIRYGRNQAEAAADYLQETAPDQIGRVHVCSFSSDSTEQELAEISTCIRGVAPHAHSGLVVTSTYHTRRALEIARRVHPEYSWSAAAASDPDFDVHWWRTRQHAKTLLMEWQKLAWWTIVEQWTAKGPKQ